VEEGWRGDLIWGFCRSAYLAAAIRNGLAAKDGVFQLRPEVKRCTSCIDITVDGLLDPRSQRIFCGLGMPRALAICSNPSSFLNGWIWSSSFFSRTFSQVELDS
jgi:hypothetical protein